VALEAVSVRPEIKTEKIVINGPEALIGEEGRSSLLVFAATSFREEAALIQVTIEHSPNWMVWYGSQLMSVEREISHSNILKTSFYLPPFTAKIFPFWVKFPNPLQGLAAIKIRFEDAT